MQIGMVGAGRMGANLVRRLLRAGHKCVVYDRNAESASELVDEGAVVVESLQELARSLESPRTVWVMVPAAVTGRVVDELAETLDADDVIIDGGNSHYRDSVVRHNTLAQRQIHYVDVGTSGGVYGLERGYCLMIGGGPDAVERLDPIFRTLAPGTEAAPRTPGRTGVTDTAENGYLHCGPAGAGHFTKMIHNGIEYGQMAALAEGIAILQKANSGHAPRVNDAETAPLADADFYSYDLDIAAITEVWRRGSVISSWLLNLTAGALLHDPQLNSYSRQVADSGEGRWTVQAAVDVGVPAHVLTAALYARFSSRGEGEYADKALSAMRRAFGGH
ncbi:phosphogluconate dehydrogenase (NAD(+)-dependent, decarboxylating) [Rhodococcus sp. B10]|uniref:phosphogluconate dehydrogenase (NAD(+)-dependent, decarboxylating) n=1 Tax=Rhodococcus sp. B10 TaxID=2695876 RepID=UPI00143224EE|nr:decarboxylating 6-phosphogluconate dehydrogenase [Rhodococcus sp. B10]NIL78948.1 6-phosphogluconate dehydrogenase, NAD(+)-dependent, decarboxylating [Rhodococcus sp. B10]